MIRHILLTSIFRAVQAFRSQTRSFATSAGASAKRLHPNVLGLVIGAGAVGAAAGTLISRARCSDDVLVAPAYPWSHKSEWKSYDVARCVTQTDLNEALRSA